MLGRRAFLQIAAAVLMTGAASSAQAGSEVTWRVGHAQPQNAPVVKRMEALSNTISERSGGRFSLEIDNMTAHGFSAPDGLRLVAQQRVYDVVHHFPDYVVRDEPLFAAGVVPLHGLVDREDNEKVLQIQQEVANQIAAKWGLRFAAFQHVSGEQVRVYLFSKKPFASLEDLKSIKLRHWARSGVQIFSAAGVPAQVIPAADLYLALQNGTVDATVYPVNYALAGSLNEVTTYASYIAPYVASAPVGFLVRQETWDALPDDLKEIWTAATLEQWEEARASYAKDDIEGGFVEELKKRGMTILDPLPEADRQTLQREALRVWREDAEKLGPQAVENYNHIVAALGIGG